MLLSVSHLGRRVPPIPLLKSDVTGKSGQRRCIPTLSTTTRGFCESRSDKKQYKYESFVCYVVGGSLMLK